MKTAKATIDLTKQITMIIPIPSYNYQMAV